MIVCLVMFHIATNCEASSTCTCHCRSSHGHCSHLCSGGIHMPHHRRRCHRHIDLPNRNLCCCSHLDTVPQIEQKSLSMADAIWSCWKRVSLRIQSWIQVITFDLQEKQVDIHSSLQRCDPLAICLLFKYRSTSTVASAAVLASCFLRCSVVKSQCWQGHNTHHHTLFYFLLQMFVNP